MQAFIRKVTELHSRLLRLEGGFHIDEIKRDEKGTTVNMHAIDNSETKYTARVTEQPNHHYKVMTERVTGSNQQTAKPATESIPESETEAVPETALGTPRTPNR